MEKLWETDYGKQRAPAVHQDHERPDVQPQRLPHVVLGVDVPRPRRVVLGDPDGGAARG